METLIIWILVFQPPYHKGKIVENNRLKPKKFLEKCFEFQKVDHRQKRKNLNDIVCKFDFINQLFPQNLFTIMFQSTKDVFLLVLV